MSDALDGWLELPVETWPTEVLRAQYAKRTAEVAALRAALQAVVQAHERSYPEYWTAMKAVVDQCRALAAQGGGGWEGPQCICGGRDGAARGLPRMDIVCPSCDGGREGSK